ncbi:NAD(P)/FAD-dependent oxidoreductase [Rudaeicoccus suwonensis]|uniref:Glycine/D-amino acid oxidase-like deaminating enzyme n=1 Tax=Rudaeicoccus suwonensis TaxID=657409 RepID=A0A561E3S0_9MICO|nr:FAD-binding oxidoreductase [Rudaeicoccus suwonensis]TWE10258.1 glycine/D-amino acid oxidase-like deaminating enzyme [Rudaeicoccus suwonensis]
MKLISYWQDTTAPPGDFRKIPVPENVDVAIVGAGLTGLSAALELARGGATVAVLEAHHVGWGASNRNAGMATTGLAIGFGQAVKRYGRDRAVEYYLEYDKAISTVESLVHEHSIDCDFTRSGKLSLALTPRDVAAMRTTQRAIASIGALPDLMVLGPDEVGKEIGSHYYHGGMVDPLGAGLHVGKFVSGLAVAAVAAGATICEDSPVVSLSREGARHVVQTTRGVVSAKEVLIATSGYTSALTPWLQRRVIPVGSFVICTEPLGDALAADVLPHRRMASDAKMLTYYFRLTPDNRLLFGGRARFALSSPDSDQRSAQILRSAMVEIFPQLGDRRIDYTWGGLVDISMDQMVHVGEHSGVHYSLGYSGHGVQMATHSGQQIARKLLGLRADLPFSGIAFRPVPGHVGPPWFLPFIGAGAHVVDRWNLLRGGKS